MSESKMAVIRPQGVSRDIGHDNRLSPECCGAARSHTWADLHAVNSLTVFLGERRRCAVPQGLAITIQKEYGAQHSPVVALDRSTEGVQDCGKGSSAYHHGQNVLVEKRQDFRQPSPRRSCLLCS